VVSRTFTALVDVPMSIRVPTTPRRIRSLPVVRPPSTSARVLRIGIPFPSCSLGSTRNRHRWGRRVTFGIGGSGLRRWFVCGLILRLLFALAYTLKNEIPGSCTTPYTNNPRCSHYTVKVPSILLGNYVQRNSRNENVGFIGG